LGGVIIFINEVGDVVIMDEFISSTHVGFFEEFFVLDFAKEFILVLIVIENDCDTLRSEYLEVEFIDTFD